MNVFFVVAPRWMMEPQDTALMLGQAVVVNCEADGYPQPQIMWAKGGNNIKDRIKFHDEYIFTIK